MSRECQKTNKALGEVRDELQGAPGSVSSAAVVLNSSFNSSIVAVSPVFSLGGMISLVAFFRRVRLVV